MKIIVFGATGSIGKQVLHQSIDEGHVVTAFARTPEKVKLNHPNLEVIQGDVLNLTDVEKAVKDQDVVICVLGAGRHGNVRSSGTRNIISAMKTAGVKRLICQSSLGVGDSRKALNFFWKYIMFGFLLRPAYQDHTEQEELVRQSGLDWIIVRPASFIDGEHTGHYRHGFASDDRTTTLKISRADVADFIIKQLQNNHYLNKTPGLSY